MNISQRNEINGNNNINNNLMNNSNSSINFFQNVRIEEKISKIRCLK